MNIAKIESASIAGLDRNITMSKQPFFKPESQEELRKRIMVGSATQEDYRQFAHYMFAIGQHEESILFYKKALDLSPQNIQKADISLELGWVMYEMSRRAEAQELAQNAINLLSKQIETPEVLLSRGAAHALLSQCLSFTNLKSSTETARLGLDVIERVMAEIPDSEKITSAYYLAARLHSLLGNTEKTVTLCEKCLQHELENRERLECMLILVEALRSQGRFSEAEHAMEDALRQIDTDKQYVEADKRIRQRLSLERGLIQRLSNRLADAAKTFKKMLVEVKADTALRNDPGILGTVYWNLGAVLFEISDYPGAATALEKALGFQPQNEPNHYKVLLSLGDCYLGTAAYARARDCYEKVVASPHSLDAEKLNACAGIAKVLYESGEYTKAASAFETLLSDYSNNDPNYYNLLLWLGNCYEGMRVNAKARDCYEKVLASPSAWDVDKASARKALIRLSSSGEGQIYH